jgi:predicted transposase/invertase (TIGR01784 family)
MPEEEIHQPNDKLFSSTFGIPENTAGLLSAKLPRALSSAVNWDQLSLLPGSFVDSQFRRSHTDLLFSAPIGENDGFIYLLFEHQSTLDRLLPLRLLRYMTRIWESVEKSDVSRAKLPVILPVVLSQNADVWDVSPQFASLLDVPESLAAELRPYYPDFSYIHLQLSEMSFEAIPGTASGIFVLRAMKAERLGELLGNAVWDENLILRVPRELFQIVLRYIVAGEIDKEVFKNKLKAISDPEIRANAMTLAQQLHQEGRQEGRQEILQANILEALEIRFEEVPAGLREAVVLVTDDLKLREMHRAAIQCASLDAFAAAL